ncbi:MAG: UspA domain protein [Pedosphaera sp.]|nr:UspA domain protein [Pedosphaera sp.]
MKILICNDGSEPADKATRLGANIAAACNAEVTLLGIIEAPGRTEPILDALRRGLQLLKDQKIRAELVTITGQPIVEIIKRTEEVRFDLVVIGAMRKETSGPFWVSSKSYKIIKSIRPPVLVVLEKTSAIRRIVICTGGRKYIDNAVALTGQIARGMHASVTLFHVMPAPPALYAHLPRMDVNVRDVLASKSELGRNLREEKATLESLGVPTEVKLRRGPVLQEIFREIQGGDYDLVVTGSSLSHGNLRTYILGDITREIVNRCTCAVLVVRAEMKNDGTAHGLTGWLGRLSRRTTAIKHAGEK